jgi:hypothetical protein
LASGCQHGQLVSGFLALSQPSANGPEEGQNLFCATPSTITGARIFAMLALGGEADIPDQRSQVRQLLCRDDCREQFLIAPGKEKLDRAKCARGIAAIPCQQGLRCNLTSEVRWLKSMCDKRTRRSLRRYRKIEAQMDQKEGWARIRKFNAAAGKSVALSNQTRSICAGGEIPNSQ